MRKRNDIAEAGRLEVELSDIDKLNILNRLHEGLTHYRAYSSFGDRIDEDAVIKQFFSDPQTLKLL